MGLCKNATLPVPSGGLATPVETGISTGATLRKLRVPVADASGSWMDFRGFANRRPITEPLAFQGCRPSQAGPLHSLFNRHGSPSIDIGVSEHSH